MQFIAESEILILIWASIQFSLSAGPDLAVYKSY